MIGELVLFTPVGLVAVVGGAATDEPDLLLFRGCVTDILEGDALTPPARMTLREVHRADDHVFLHYRVVD